MSAGANAPVLRARVLRKQYGQGEGLVRAVDGVDLEVAAGETVAVMGPSGCGRRPGAASAARSVRRC
jgi:putative ABC transport system ATP-binding protein